MTVKCALGFLENGSTVKLPDGQTGVKEGEGEGKQVGKVIIRLPDQSVMMTPWSTVAELVAAPAKPTRRTNPPSALGPPGAEA